MNRYSSLESLETRIAPATLLPGGKGVTYTDVDGDLVTVKLTKAVDASAFTFNNAFGSSGPQQLQKIDLAASPDAVGTNLTFTVKKVAGGDGQAHLGELRAADKDLGIISIKGDLGQISAGDSDATVPGVKSLSVASLGRFDLVTQGGMGDTASVIKAGLGSLSVKGDVYGEFNVFNGNSAQTGNIKSVFIGGSLIGGSKTNSGQIYTGGNVGTVKIVGNIIGGSGTSSGQLNVGGNLGSVTLGGSLIGGSYDAAQEFTAAGAIFCGRVVSSTSLDFVSIGGEVRGGPGNFSGFIGAGVGVGASGSLGTLQVKKGIIGGDGDKSGFIHIHGDAKSVSVLGDLRGGDGLNSGSVLVDADFISARIGGSLEGGDGAHSGSIRGELSIGTLTIGRDVLSGHAGGAADSLISSGGSLIKLTVGGSMLATVGAGADKFIDVERLGALQVKGGIVGTSTDRVVLEVSSGSETNGPLASLTVGKDFQNADLLVSEGVAGAQVGKISIGRDFLASRIALSSNAGVDGILGTDDDSSADSDAAPMASRIASLLIKGRAEGTFTPGDSYLITAAKLGSVKIGGRDFTPNPDAWMPSTSLGLSGDLFLRSGVPIVI